MARFSSLATASLIMTAALGCGGGGDAAAPTGPAPGASPPTGYAVSGAVTGLPAAETIVLSLNNGAESKILGNGNFNFATKLGAGTSYSVTLAAWPSAYTCTVSNGEGVIGTSDVANVAVNCAPKVTAPSGLTGKQISYSRGFMSYDVYSGDVAINNNGVAIATWTEVSKYTDKGHRWVNVKRDGAWGTPLEFEDIAADGGSLSIAPNGDAILAYVQKIFTADGYLSGQQIMMRRYQYGANTWTAPELLSAGTATGFASDPVIAMDSMGNAFAMWQEGQQLWARRFDAATGWEGGLKQLSSGQLPGIASGDIVVDGAGAFTAVWREKTTSDGGGKTTLFADRYNGAWTGRQLIGLDPATLGRFDGSSDWHVSSNNAGQVFVTWIQKTSFPDGSYQWDVDAARFDPGSSTWSAPQPIATGREPLYHPQVAIDESGRARAVWVWRNGLAGDVYSIKTSSFDPATTSWSAVTYVDETGSSANIYRPFLAMDRLGNAVAVWDDSQGYVARRFDASTGTWGSFNRMGAGNMSALDMNDSGQTIMSIQKTITETTQFSYSIWAYEP